MRRLANAAAWVLMGAWAACFLFAVATMLAGAR